MDLFSFIKNNVDIVDIIGEYTHLKKAGSMYWKGRCPFHHEKTPSFTVSPHKNIFYCFGCHEHGDAISFIEKIEQITAFEATQHLVERYNLQIPDDIASTQHKKNEHSKNYYDLCHTVAEWCNNKLLKNKQALSYLEKRSFDRTIFNQFVLGFFPSGSQSITQLITEISFKGFTVHDLEQANILFRNKNSYYSPFENRIVFPIKDHLKRVCGFGGRTFKPDDERVKYYNSKETAAFKKGQILYGFDIAKQEVQKEKSIFLVEGYTDCIAMHQHGLKNTVATLGTACTIDHLKLLARHAQTIYIMYDGDNAGKKAILRMTEHCWKLDMDVKVIMLPNNHDPASLIESNIELTPLIEQAPDIFTFFLQTTGDNFQQQNFKNKLTAIHDLLELINHIPDLLKKNILLTKAAEILQIPLDILEKEYTNRNNNKNADAINSNQNTITKKISHSIEQQILATILHDPSITTEQQETILLTSLPEEECILAKKVFEHKKEMTASKYSLATHFNPAEIQYIQKLLLSFDMPNIKQTFNSLMHQFQKKYWKSITSHIKIQLEQAKRINNIEKIKELIDTFEKLKIELFKRGPL